MMNTGHSAGEFLVNAYAVLVVVAPFSDSVIKTNLQLTT